MSTKSEPDIVVEDRVTIQRPREDVFASFWDPRLWEKVSPHVVRVEMIQGDDRFQKFRMTIRSDGGEHHSVSERIAERPELIRYRQLSPPELLRRHSGEWHFSEGRDGCTEVTLRHMFLVDTERCVSRWPELSPEETLQRVTAIIHENGNKTLLGLKAELERQ